MPDYDFQWATIGDAGNPGYDGPVRTDGFPGGRGSVGYTYRMSRLEVTTGQWLEYINTFTTQSDGMAFFLDEPNRWGAQSDLSYPGPGRRYALDPSHPNPAMSPVAGLSWRDAARFCNWLHGGKSSDPASLITGAYDTTTWGPGPTPGTYTDAERHLPGARFWIPTLDEYLKAAHFDPNKNGVGVGGWWDFSNRSDVAGPLSGPPGVGESSVGTDDWRIPLGSYPQTQSAYGLLDLSGGSREWLENLREDFPITERFWDGPSVFSGDLRTGDFALSSLDRALNVGTGGPTIPSSLLGLRVASIPAPSALPILLTVWTIGRVSVRRKR
ncbi:MAG: SUMF1/EgtB/PvdO family nonheme iron enzyme [Phycisphaerales bacterium]|nr:SUMF1/EgtB/PvdO family nonheme iron enzyme [Phycisphaerales bacterium]